jgi:4-hydroxy-tetrahydrodipicolinate synthase
MNTTIPQINQYFKTGYLFIAPGTSSTACQSNTCRPAGQIQYNRSMHGNSKLKGVFAAALTPLHSDGTLALEDLPPLLAFLARRGCHGALLLGTTGEGPSFSPQERRAIFQTALQVRQEFPDFRLLGGTGTPSLDETVELTRMAFDLGLDGVVVLPPYYYRQVSDAGLFAWYETVIRRAVPDGGAFLVYHIPPVSGVPISLDLLARLLDAFPTRFTGIKDSSADPDHARALGARFGTDLTVLNGTDNLFSLALKNSASGCITALANLAAPVLRRVWEAHQRGQDDPQAGEVLHAARAVIRRHPPAAPLLKAALASGYGFPHWGVRPPLCSLSADQQHSIIAEFGDMNQFDG